MSETYSYREIKRNNLDNDVTKIIKSDGVLFNASVKFSHSGKFNAFCFLEQIVFMIIIVSILSLSLTNINAWS